MPSPAPKDTQLHSVPETQVPPVAEAVKKVSEQTFMPVLRSYNAWLDSAAKVQAESLRFVLDRVRKDLEMQARLAECKSPVDMLEVQAKFASTMVADYLTETGKLLSLTMQGLRDSAGEAEQAKRD